MLALAARLRTLERDRRILDQVDAVTGLVTAAGEADAYRDQTLDAVDHEGGPLAYRKAITRLQASSVH